MRNIQRIRSLATTPMTFTAANTYIGQVGELVSVFDDSDGTAVALRIHDGNTVGGLLYYQINSYVAPEDTGTSSDLVSDNSGSSMNDGVYSGWLNENVIDYSAYFDGSSELNRNSNNWVNGNRKTWTWSGWVKREKINSPQPLFASSNPSTSHGFYFGIESNDQLRIVETDGGGFDLYASQPLRDLNSWYHFTLAVDTTQEEPSNRIKLYINGNHTTSFSAPTYPSENQDYSVNNEYTHYIGAKTWEGNINARSDGHMANIQFIDGAALDASYFGETVEGNWIHKPLPADQDYGAKGFYLNFADELNLGKDVSGNGNDWT